MTGFHPQTSVNAPFRGSFLRSDQKQKAAFVCGSSLGPACLKITINRLLTGKTSGKYISKYYYFYCIKPMCVRVRASTVVGSFVCSVSEKRSHRVKKPKQIHLHLVEGWQHLKDLEHNTCAQAPKTAPSRTLSVSSLSLLLDKLS